MKRPGSLLIESLIALMILVIAIIFIGRGLGPLKRMTDDAVIQQDLLDLGASIADEILSGIQTSGLSDQKRTINQQTFSYDTQFSTISLSDISDDTDLPSTVTVQVAHATISTVGIDPERTLSFSVFPFY